MVKKKERDNPENVKINRSASTAKPTYSFSTERTDNHEAFKTVP